MTKTHQLHLYFNVSECEHANMLNYDDKHGNLTMRF